MGSDPVVVVGLGAMGSAACAHLARRGVPVIGIDRFTPPHDQGSSHGGSRVARRAYFEHPDYVPLLEKAFRGWESLEQDTGLTCLKRVGVLLIGQPDSEILRASRLSAEQRDIDVRALSAVELATKFPQFCLPEGMHGLLEPDGGFVVPENGIQAHHQMARKYGVEFRFGARVLGIEADDDGGVVRLEDGEIRASRIVVTAGAWVNQLLPDLASRVVLTPQRKHIVWFRPRDAAAFTVERMPVWIIDDGNACGDGLYYGVPTWPDQIGPEGVKIGFHGPGTPVDPDRHDRTPDPEVIERFRADVARFLPDLDREPVAAATCLYTMSPDQQFVIDLLPGARSVAFATGFSGHGYKFAPVVGQLLADLALDGDSELPAGFLRLARFRES